MKRPEDIADFTEVQRALAAYLASRDELRALGVLRSERSVSSDFAEWLVARMLGLHLSRSGVQRGYDATDAEGTTYQIKARLVATLRQATSFDLREPQFPFDVLLAVFLSPYYQVLGIARLPAAKVLAQSHRNQRSRRLRWTKALLNAPWVEWVYRSDEAANQSPSPVASNLAHQH